MLEGGDTGQFEPATAGKPSTRCEAEERILLVRLGRANKHSTLLGPEGTTESRLCREVGISVPGKTARAHRPLLRCWCFQDVVLGWSLVENCTVDASILFSVVKLSRANGGCLGTRSR